MIASTVALCEEYVGIDDMVSDGVIDKSIKNALVPLSSTVGGSVQKYSAGGLVPSGKSGGAKRL